METGKARKGPRSATLKEGVRGASSGLSPPKGPPERWPGGLKKDPALGGMTRKEASEKGKPCSVGFARKNETDCSNYRHRKRTDQG